MLTSLNQKLKKYENRALFNFNNQTITLTNIKKIIPEFFKITHYQYEKSKIKGITF